MLCPAGVDDPDQLDLDRAAEPRAAAAEKVTLKTADLDYALPQDLIAQTPIEPRDAARLLVLDRAGGTLAHRHFQDLGEYLRRGDVLVFNDTRVLHARLSAVKIPTGGHVEVLLLKRLDEVTWETLVRGAGVRGGTRLKI